MQTRKGKPGYVRVPLPRSAKRGGTTIAHFWVKETNGTPSPPTSGGLRELGVDLEDPDADDILTQEIIYAFEGSSPSWRKVSEGFSPDSMAREYGDRFRDARILQIVGEEQDLYCVAAHGAASLTNAIQEELFSEDGSLEGEWSVGQAASLLWGFTNWSKLRRHGVVPVDVTADDPPFLSSVTINGQTPLSGGVPVFASGDIMERDVPDAKEVLSSLRMWQEKNYVSPLLSDVVHQYSGVITINKLHRTFFFPDKSSWEKMLDGFRQGEGWGLNGDVMDFYQERHHFVPEGEPKSGQWSVRLEAFDLEGLPVKALVESCGEATAKINAKEWLVPGPITVGVLKIDAIESDTGGVATVYLLAPPTDKLRG